MPKKKNKRERASSKRLAEKDATQLDVPLPKKIQPWINGGRKAIHGDRSSRRSLSQELNKVNRFRPWEWPKRRVLFFTDLHADADAFISSLIASGGVKRTGTADDDFKLTNSGRKALFIIGGDCFDKGPGNLRLLRVIKALRDQGAQLKILAGNHDIRMLLGIRAIAAQSPRNEHFFVRMGPKMVPFLREVWDHYLKDGPGLAGVPRSRECHRALYPSNKWFKRFPFHAGWVMPTQTVKQELKRMRKKIVKFGEDCEKAGMSIRMVYAAAMQWRRLFLHRKGEFSWFFNDMTLTHREGSFLFIHAGLDDRVAQVIHDKGLKALNRTFRLQMHGDPFEFYYGPLANMIRTKYRPVDMPLTTYGATLIHDMGIHAIVHGHLSLRHGQRMMLRQGIVNFQCDTTMDRNTRKKDGLSGIGAAATIIDPGRWVSGISRDYPFQKIFEMK